MEKKGSKVSFWFAQKLTFLQLYRGEGGLGDLKIDILHFVSSLTEVLKDCTDIQLAANTGTGRVKSRPPLPCELKHKLVLCPPYNSCGKKGIFFQQFHNQTIFFLGGGVEGGSLIKKTYLICFKYVHNSKRMNRSQEGVGALEVRPLKELLFLAASLMDI